MPRRQQYRRFNTLNISDSEIVDGALQSVRRIINTVIDQDDFTHDINDNENDNSNTAIRAAGFGRSGRFNPDGGDDSRNIKIPELEQIENKNSERRRLGLLRENLKHVRPSFSSDPIAQSFTITEDMVRNNGGVGFYATGVDVFFYSKSGQYGITLEIRELVNGRPSQKVLPFSRVSLRSKDVSTSNDASIACQFQFKCPVYLKADTQYAFILKPDNNNNDYRVFTAKLGETDRTTNSLINKDWGSGVLFIGTNDSIWNPVFDEDLKFNLWGAYFPSLSGDVILTNDDHEYLTVEQPEYTFVNGERVFIENDRNNFIKTGTVTCYPESCAIDISNASSFSTDVLLGDWITVGDEDNGYDILQVESIDTDNNIAIVEGHPTVFANNVPYRVTPTAEIYYFNSTVTQIHLNESTANSADFSFKDGDVIRGDISSNATANVISVDNKPISYFEPMIYRFIPENTESRLYIKTTDSEGNIDDEFVEYNFANRNYFSDKEKFIFSKSNEITNSNLNGNKSVEIKIEMDSDYIELSPVIDLQNSSILRYENLINDNSEGETGSDGNAVVRQIQKPVTLAEGLEAEDLKVYLTAYVPGTTAIEVYAKFHSSTDPESFVEKEWTKLDNVKNAGIESSRLNLYDYKELEFNIPTTPDTATLNGVVNVAMGNNIVNGTGTEFTKTYIEFATDTDPTFSTGDVVVGTISGAKGTVTKTEYANGFGEITINTRIGEFEIGEKLIVENEDVDADSAVISYIDADYLIGDLFKIIKSNEIDDYILTRIASINNDTQLVLSDNVGSAVIDSQYQKVLTPHSAYKNPDNDFIMQYHDNNFTVHNQYKSYQLKIVLLAETTHIVPRVADMRSISLSV